jgi:hypothetical protein
MTTNTPTSIRADDESAVLDVIHGVGLQVRLSPFELSGFDTLLSNQLS